MKPGTQAPEGWEEPIGRFLEDLRIKGRSRATITSYGASLRVAACYFQGRACFGWQDVTGTHFQGLAVHLLRKGLSRMTVATYGAAIRGLLRRMGRHAAADGMPFRLGVYTRKRNPCRLEPEQARGLIERTADPLERAFLAVLYGGGLRISEALDLTLEQGRALAATGQAIIKGKGDVERLAIIGSQAAADVAAYLEVRAGLPVIREPGRLWLHPHPGRYHGRRLGSALARAMVKEAGHRIGLHVLPHDLRHAFARHVYRGIGEHLDAPGDVGLDLVRRMMGHANPETTCIYLDASAGSDPDLVRAIAHHPGARGN